MNTDKSRLTLQELGYLADIVRGVESNATLRWWQDANQSKPLEVIMRSIQSAPGALWFDKDDNDVRDAVIWCSGTFEHWFKVSELAEAMWNMVYGGDTDKPLATIERS